MIKELFLAIILISLTPQINQSIGTHTLVLVELPTGEIYWSEGNATYLRITEKICKEHNLTYKIYDSVAIIEGFVLHLYHWSNGWKYGKGEMVAWSDGFPLATPNFKYPRLNFQAQHSQFPAGPNLIWNVSIGSGMFGAVDGTAVGAKNKIFIESWSGLYAITPNATIIWKNSSIRGMSTPLLYNNTIYVGASDGYIYALDLNGAVIFKKKISDSPGYTGLSSSPIAVNHTIYVAGYESDNHSAMLYALDEKGAVLWNMSLNSTVYFGSLAYRNGTIYLPLSGLYNSSNGHWYPKFGLMAVRNGKRLWDFQTASSVKSTPLIYHDAIYFTSTDGFLYSLSMEGKLRWKLHIGYSTSSPNAYNGTIFVGSGEFDKGSIYAVSENGTLLWKQSVNGGVQSSITISPPFILFTYNAKHGGVECLDMKGNKIWNFTAQNYVLSSPSLINGKLYFGDDSGIVYCLTDKEKPTVEFQGREFYKFGDTISLFVNASDNVGVKNLTVSWRWGHLRGHESVKIKLKANFTGMLTFRAVAVDYSGNTNTVIYSIYSYNRSLEVSIQCPEHATAGLVHCSVKVTDDRGNLISGAKVYVYLDSSVIASGTTEGGFFSFSFNCSAGNHTLKAVAKLRGYAQSEAVRHINVFEEHGHNENSMSFLLPISFLIALIVTFAVVSSILLKRRQKGYEEINRERLKNERKLR